MLGAAPPRPSPSCEGTRPHPAPGPEPESSVVVPGARSARGATDAPREAAETPRGRREPPRAGSTATGAINPAGLITDSPPCAPAGAGSGSSRAGARGAAPPAQPGPSVSSVWLRASRCSSGPRAGSWMSGFGLASIPASEIFLLPRN